MNEGARLTPVTLLETSAGLFSFVLEAVSTWDGWTTNYQNEEFLCLLNLTGEIL